MKAKIKDGFLYFIYVLAAEYIGFLVSLFVLMFVRFFTEDNWGISSFVSANIGSIIALYIMCRRFGYKDADESFKFTFKSTVPFIIGLAVYILLNVITNYRNPSGLNSMFLTNIFIGECDLDLKELSQNHSGALFLGTAINTIIKYPFMVLGYKSGVNKRIADRQQLFASKTIQP